MWPTANGVFAVKVGTIIEDSKIPLGKWALAFYLMSTNLKRRSGPAHRNRLLSESLRTGGNRPRLYISLRIFTILPPNKGHFDIVCSQRGGILRLSTAAAMRSGETIGPGGQLAVFQTTGRQESSSEGPPELSDEPAPRRCSRRVQGLWEPCAGAFWAFQPLW